MPYIRETTITITGDHFPIKVSYDTQNRIKITQGTSYVLMSEEAFDQICDALDLIDD